MNKKLLLIPLLFLGQLNSMNWGQLLDETHTALQKEIVDALPANSIALIGSDNNEPITISIAAANQSETLKNLIGDIAANKILQLSQIKSETLKEIVAFLNALKKNEDLGDNKLKNRALLDSLEQRIAVSDPFALLAAANYLDIPVILHLAARRIAREEIATKSEKLSTHFKETWKRLFGNVQDLMPLIARYYFLLHRQNLPEIAKPNYALSVQDYLDYIPSRVQLITRGLEKILDLNHAHLTSLTGIENIPGINEVTQLLFYKNNLTEIADFLFTLTNVNRVVMAKNLISEIPIKICQLSQLKFLNLDGNKITHIPACINQMSFLKELSLEGNQISEIPDLSNTSIVALWLNNNRITRIPPSLGAMHRLELLNLANNQIPVSLANLTGFNSLKVLRLDHNDFTRLVHELENNFAAVMAAIARIPHLRDIGLQGLILNAQTKNKLIRHANLLQIKLRLDQEQ